MALRRSWCDVCRGGAEREGDLIKCASCPRRFHEDCCEELRDAEDRDGWQCPHCTSDDAGGKDTIKAAKAATKRTRLAHARLRGRSCAFFQREQERLAPFVPAERLKKLQERKPTKAAAAAEEAEDAAVPHIGPREDFVHAEIRPYQRDGVNWIVSQYNLGVGGILADEMGLGKTLETLAFLSALKAAGLPGPHLVVTPLAVLQNWANEIKRFTPGLTFIKVHGSQGERDRILSMPKVLGAEFDVYLTTYETMLSEEAFFAESFLFHTITIDEGHRLKNEGSMLAAALARITVPFRLLLTGTPLQNDLNELWALMQYILPEALEGCKATFTDACSISEGQLDRTVVAQARALLESLMIRRVKADVEKTLKPKIQYVLKVPLSSLQRQWYRRFLASDSEAQAMVSRAQLIMKIQQLQKVINHPKVVLYALERERIAARSLAKRAEGSEFVSVPQVLQTPGAGAQAMEAELRNLQGMSLIQSSGKLHLLDRLLGRLRAEGSRVLLFSQFTLTLDVLAEYCAARFGPEGRGYLRLEGGTNRIKREMDVRAFNAPDSRIPIYLISTRAGGQGINLATADAVVLYDTCWNPQVDLQAQDRAHRIGQRKQVRVFRLIAEATMEERVLARARQKLVLDALVIKNQGEQGSLAEEMAADDGDGGAEEEAMEKLSLDELWSLLSFGAEQVRDPELDESAPLTENDLDTIIASGRLKEGAEAPADDSWGEGAAAAAAPDASSAAAAAARTAQDMLVDTSDEEESEPEDPNSINVVPSDRIQAVLGEATTQAIVEARERWPFLSRADCARRVSGLGETKLTMLDRAGIIFITRKATKAERRRRRALLGLNEKDGKPASGPQAEKPESEQQQERQPQKKTAVAKHEDPNSINVVSLKRLQAVMHPHSPVLARLLAAREERPFSSRADCMARVEMCGEAKISALEAAGIVFPDQEAATEAQQEPGEEDAEEEQGEQVQQQQRQKEQTEDPNSINLVSLKRLQSVLQRDSPVLARLIAAREERPFSSREDCMARVASLGETKVAALEAAGIVFTDLPDSHQYAAETSSGHWCPTSYGREPASEESSAGKTASGRRVAPPPKRYAPVELHATKAKRPKLRHEDYCFSCQDGGELVECSVCPKVYHATTQCAGLIDNKVPPGLWHCPWHACWECDRKSSQAGGMLFHCMSCPMSYCFDCCPDRYSTQRSGTTAHKSVAAMLEKRGCSTKSYLFFSCDGCEEAKEAERKRRAEQREAARLEAWNRPEAVAARAAAAAAAKEAAQQKAAALGTEADELIATSQFQMAIGVLNRALRIDPDNADIVAKRKTAISGAAAVLGQQAEVLVASKKLGSALNVLQRAVAMDPDSTALQSAKAALEDRIEQQRLASEAAKRAASAAAAAAAAIREAAAKAERVARAWEQHQDPSRGVTYWWNRETDESRWTNPFTGEGPKQLSPSPDSAAAQPDPSAAAAATDAASAQKQPQPQQNAQGQNEDGQPTQQGANAFVDNDPNSINNASLERLQAVLQPQSPENAAESLRSTHSRVLHRLLEARAQRPFTSRTDCMKRVDSLGMGKVAALQEAGIVFPGEEHDSSRVIREVNYRKCRQQLSEMSSAAIENIPSYEVPDSINVVSVKRIEDVLGRGAVALRLIEERNKWPFMSRAHCLSRVGALGETRVRKLESAGIVFRSRAPTEEELSRKPADVEGPRGQLVPNGQAGQKRKHGVRGPSAYNVFVKTEVARLKTEKPEMSHDARWAEVVAAWNKLEGPDLLKWQTLADADRKKVKEAAPDEADPKDWKSSVEHDEETGNWEAKIVPTGNPAQVVGQFTSKEEAERALADALQKHRDRLLGGPHKSGNVCASPTCGKRWHGRKLCCDCGFKNVWDRDSKAKTTKKPAAAPRPRPRPACAVSSPEAAREFHTKMLERGRDPQAKRGSGKELTDGDKTDLQQRLKDPAFASVEAIHSKAKADGPDFVLFRKSQFDCLFGPDVPVDKSADRKALSSTLLGLLGWETPETRSRATSAYSVFYRAEMVRRKAEAPEQPPKERQAAAIAAWKALSREDVERFQKLAALEDEQAKKAAPNGDAAAPAAPAAAASGSQEEQASAAVESVVAEIAAAVAAQPAAAASGAQEEQAPAVDSAATEIVVEEKPEAEGTAQHAAEPAETTQPVPETTPPVPETEVTVMDVPAAAPAPAGALINHEAAAAAAAAPAGSAQAPKRKPEAQHPEEGAHLLDPNSINTVDEARLKAVLCKGTKPAAVFMRLIAARNERPFTCRADCMARVASLGQTKIAALEAAGIVFPVVALGARRKLTTTSDADCAACQGQHRAHTCAKASLLTAR